MKSQDESTQAYLRKLVPLYEHIDLSIESASDGVYRCKVPLSDQNTNHIHTIHAAIQWAAAEMLGGLVIAVNFRGLPLFVAVRSVAVEFLRPARSAIIAEMLFSDDRVEEIRRQLETDGSVDFEVCASVRDDAGLEVATTTGSYVVRMRRDSAPSGKSG